MQVKVFSGQPEKVEKAINHWCDDGGARQVLSITPLIPQGEGEVAMLFIFNPVIPGIVQAKNIPTANGVN